jgi:hypothetical protein
MVGLSMFSSDRCSPSALAHAQNVDASTLKTKTAKKAAYSIRYARITDEDFDEVLEDR